MMIRRPLSSAAGAVTIEPMRRRHLRSIMAIEAQVYPRGWSLGVFQTEVALARKGERHYVVARLDGAVVGYAGMLFAGEDAHVTTVAVDPRVQRNHIGTRLMLDLARTARGAGARNLTLEVRVSNEPAQQLYRSFGFVPAGIRRRYYENVEDALVMWCHDIDGPEYLETLHHREQAL
jgi:ribosomal-protein-alanine N-acetyltransferase